MEKSDGSRTLLVPVVRDADTLDFRGFWGAYEELIRKVRSNKLSPDDFAGITVSLTNPGTIGTQQSVPRLMPGQGLIVGVGSLDYPTAWKAADPVTLADLGVSKVITITSTYDHRIIQGAESGLFLKRVEELLLGDDGFYDEVFRALGVPYEAVQWRRDVNPIDREQAMLEKQMAVANLIRVHRVRGHLIADLDPLPVEGAGHAGRARPGHLRAHHLGPRPRVPHRRPGRARSAWPLGDILHVLRDAYCRTIGIEYMHIQDPRGAALDPGAGGGRRHRSSTSTTSATSSSASTPPRPSRSSSPPSTSARSASASRAPSRPSRSSTPSSRRRPMPSSTAPSIGMAHRGRLNVLTNIVGKSYDQLFKEFEGQVDPESIQGSGDVKYHLGQVGKFVARSGKDITVELAANPSHLEAVDPVVVGMARAKQDAINDPEAFSVLPILMHGDAAFAGQGVVAETLNMSDIKGYRVGGTIHLVVNNQIGFTTTPESARTGYYSTDVAKIIQAPIFHVNGDDPEACVRVARLAFAYRQRFHKDVVIDMVCYRRHGHNEGDDPSYTQPMMYAKIDERRSVRKLFTESLVKRGQLSLEEAESALDDFQSRLQTALDETRQSAPAAEVLAKVPPPPAGRAAPRRDRRRARGARPDLRGAVGRSPTTSRSTPSCSSSSRPATRCGPTARSTGPWPRRWPSARCSSRAPTSASPARTPAGAPSATATRCWSTTPTATSTPRWPTSVPSRASSGSTTRCCRSTPPSASSTATPWWPRSRW